MHGVGTIKNLRCKHLFTVKNKDLALMFCHLALAETTRAFI